MMNERRVHDNSLTQAVEARDALAKTIYTHMFDWLVDRINQGMKGPAPRTAIGAI